MFSETFVSKKDTDTWLQGRVCRVRIARNNHQRCSVRKGVLRNFAKFKGKHLCQSLFFNKVPGLRPATLLKKRPWHRCFPLNFMKFLRIPFSQNTSWRLLLNSKKLTYSLPFHSPKQVYFIENRFLEKKILVPTKSLSRGYLIYLIKNKYSFRFT